MDEKYNKINYNKKTFLNKHTKVKFFISRTIYGDRG